MEHKLEIKKQIESLINEIKNDNEPAVNTTIDRLKRVMSLIENSSHYTPYAKYSCILKDISRQLSDKLDSLWWKLNEVNNPYKHCPENWLNMDANEILQEINTKWQKRHSDGRIEQEYWVVVEEKRTEEGEPYYYVYQRYNGNSGHHYQYYGSPNQSKKDSILNFYDTYRREVIWVHNFWD